MLYTYQDKWLLHVLRRKICHTTSIKFTLVLSASLRWYHQHHINLAIASLWPSLWLQWNMNKWSHADGDGGWWWRVDDDDEEEEEDVIHFLLLKRVQLQWLRLFKIMFESALVGIISYSTWHGIILISAWIMNCIHYKQRDKFPHPLPNSNRE